MSCLDSRKVNHKFNMAKRQSQSHPELHSLSRRRTQRSARTITSSAYASPSISRQSSAFFHPHHQYDWADRAAAKLVEEDLEQQGITWFSHGSQSSEDEGLLDFGNESLFEESETETSHAISGWVMMLLDWKYSNTSAAPTATRLSTKERMARVRQRDEDSNFWDMAWFLASLYCS